MGIFGKKTLSPAEKEQLCMQATNWQYEGEQRRAQKDMQGAIDCYEKALDLFRKAEFALGEGRALQGLGMFHRDLQHFDQAAVLLDQALQVFITLNDKFRQGTTYDRMGTMYWQMKDNQHSMQMYSKAAELLLEVNAPKEALDSLIAVGSLQIMEEDFSNAERTLQRALQIAQQNGIYESESQASYHLGVALQKMSRIEDAVESFSRVIHIYQTTGHEGFAPYAAKELEELGAIETKKASASQDIHPDIKSALEIYSRGQNEYAMDRLADLAREFILGKDLKNAAQAFEAMGDIHKDLGYTSIALDNFNKARDYYSQCGAKQDCAQMALKIEKINQDMQDFEL